MTCRACYWTLVFLILTTLLSNGQDLSGGERLHKARALAQDGFYQEAIAEYDAISVAFPGQEFDALSRLGKAAVLLAKSPDNGSNSTRIYEGVITDFTGTSFELYARLYLADLKLHRGLIDIESYSVEVDGVIVSAGGTSVSSFAEPYTVPKVFFEGNGQRVFLGEAYLTIADRLVSSPSEEITPALVDRAERIARFHRSQYPEQRGARNLLDRVESVRSGDESFLNRPDDTVGPIVTLLSSTIPLDNQFLMVRGHDGTRAFSQIDLSSLSLQIDGVGVSPANIEVNSLDGTIEMYEPFNFKIIPTNSWAVGSHTLSVNLSDYDENVTVASFEFDVLAPPSQSMTLPALQDSTIRAQDPHRNEGANPRLFLSHRPEKRNKSNNPIVGFDLVNTNLNGLTKASLVLNVQASRKLSGYNFDYPLDTRVEGQIRIVR